MCFPCIQPVSQRALWFLIMAISCHVAVSFMVPPIHSSMIGGGSHQRALSASPGARVTSIGAKCDKNSGLIITMNFNQPFLGTVYSVGFHGVQQCTYVDASRGPPRDTYTFVIPIGQCGTEGRYEEPVRPGQKVVIKNTVVVQNDPDLITIEDSAHTLSCTWSHSYVKPVTSRPIQVAEDDQNKVFPVVLNPISASDGRLVTSSSSSGATSWLPHDRQHNVASGLFQSKQEKNVIITVMDPFDQYDARALDCIAFDVEGGGSSAVALTDKNGCMLQLSLMPPFKKLRSPGVGLTLYSAIKDQRLAGSSNLHIKCNIQVCEKQCEAPCKWTLPPEKASHRTR